MITFVNSVFLDEKDAAVNPMTGGFMYGLGVFETIKVKNGKIIFPAEHWQRLTESLTVLNLSTAYEFEKIESICTELISANAVENGYIKIMCAQEDDGKAGMVIHTGSKVYKAEYERGFKVCMAASPKNELSSFSFIKSMNYAENIIQRQAAAVQGFDEALFVNTKGDVCECCTSNIFWIKDKTVFTPAVECGLLPGIVRGKVLALLQDIGIPFVEGKFRPGEIETADEIFLTNSLMDILPVSMFCDKIFDVAKPGLINRLMEAYKRRVDTA
jgi:branched-subunit amino acid aminotransferase/4-amino-4-deoxychorismate lyase